jgi:hypothetical protein
MTREERLARMRELLDSMRRYLPTAEQEAAVMEAKPAEIGGYRRRRPVGGLRISAREPPRHWVTGQAGDESRPHTGGDRY